MKRGFRQFYLLMVAMGLLATTAIMSSCQKENLEGEANTSPQITVEQARKSFEKELLGYGETDQDLLGLSGSVAAHADEYAITFDLNPGEYTPVWDKAHSNPAGRKAAVSTPIIPEYCYVALREYYEQDSVIRTTAVLAFQKLVALRTDGDDVRNYIATIVPTEEYYLNNQAIDATFNYGDDVDNFSGLVYYHTLDGAFYEIQKYVNGVITKRLNVVQTVSLEDFIDKTNFITGVVNFGKFPTKINYTKSWLNDDDPELLAFWTTFTLKRSQSTAIIKGIGNGYNRTFNVRSIYSQPFSAGDRNFTITNRGYTFHVRDMVVGPNPGVVNTNISGSRDFIDGSGTPCTTITWDAPNKDNRSQVQITIPQSDRDNFYNASGYDHGMNPPE